MFSETSSAIPNKPKRRAYLLKRKALTTGFFDAANKKDGEKDKGKEAEAHFIKMAPNLCYLILTLLISQIFEFTNDHHLFSDFFAYVTSR